MRDAAHIAVLYAAFATLASTANLASQAAVVALFHGEFVIVISVVVGTLIGLPVKYILDKKFIFRFTAENIMHDSKLFVFYSVLAVVTTAVFWLSEGLFQVIFNTEAMRLTGGAIGLAIGYIVKYRLDKKYVFVNREQKD